MHSAKAGLSRMERMVLGVVLMGAWCMMSSAAPASAPAPAPDCSSEITLLVPCLGYVQGSDKKPSSDCCKGLTSVVDNSPVCLCQLIESGAGAGSGINATLALQLPSKCNLKNLDPSQCSALLPGTPSPAPSPAPAHTKGHHTGVPSPSPEFFGPVPAPSAGGPVSGGSSGGTSEFGPPISSPTPASTNSAITLSPIIWIHLSVAALCTFF